MKPGDKLPINLLREIPGGDFKDMIWLKIKKDFLNIERDVYISFVYLFISPGNSNYTRKIEYVSSQNLKNHITIL